MKRRSDRQRGFTLVEMMVVVVIIGILGALAFSVSTRPYSANARTISERIVSTVNYAKLRAQATKRNHRVQVEPNVVSVWELSTTGLAVPGTSTWSLVQSNPIPNGTTVWNVTPSVVTTTGATVTQNSSLLYYMLVRPDGQATASTIYVSDGLHQWRVLTYHVTGGTYARELW